jgi:hypothetical protein
MTDIVESLRELYQDWLAYRGADHQACLDAATEIENLRGSRDEWEAAAKHYVAENERLTAACEGYLGHAAGLRAENAKLREALEVYANCRGAPGEVARAALQSKGAAVDPRDLLNENPYGDAPTDAEIDAALQSKGD